jgi:hypothetical protein
MSNHQRVWFKAKGEEIVSYLRKAGKEYWVFSQAVLEGPLAEGDE